MYLSAEARQIFQRTPLIISKNFPVPERFRKRLPADIAELSGLLTNRRGSRTLSYLGKPNFLSAYLYYYLPWNLYRLCILLQNTHISLSPGSTITDLGSGPLTFACALMIARPDLRSIPLEINCIDRCSPALEAGKKFFAALCETAGNNKNKWKINLLREDIDIRANRLHCADKMKPASLVCAANLFNEIYEKLPHSDIEGLKHIAANAAAFMDSLALKDAFLLTVEPGVPQSGRFISFMRSALMEMGRMPVSPCTHANACPLNGKKRWCHFAFNTDDIPNETQRLSAAAGIPKYRLVLSFLLTGRQSFKGEAQAKLPLRVISDAFLLPNRRFGRYACGSGGLLLLAGEKKQIEKAASFCLAADYVISKEIDKKSGAAIVYLKNSKERK